MVIVSAQTTDQTLHANQSEVCVCVFQGLGSVSVCVSVVLQVIKQEGKRFPRKHKQTDRDTAQQSKDDKRECVFMLCLL